MWGTSPPLFSAIFRRDFSDHGAPAAHLALPRPHREPNRPTNPKPTDANIVLLPTDRPPPTGKPRPTYLDQRDDITRKQKKTNTTFWTTNIHKFPPTQNHDNTTQNGSKHKATTQTQTSKQTKQLSDKIFHKPNQNFTTSWTKSKTMEIHAYNKENQFHNSTPHLSKYQTTHAQIPNSLLPETTM